ncbi:MAG: hypothetical protein KGI70_02130 [Patescibacteria group bacterium]|nr:hypothetical protein [Patescibacteria group bacterium]
MKHVLVVLAAVIIVVGAAYWLYTERAVAPAPGGGSQATSTPIGGLNK